ncbi:unnamed protein product [Arabidopsis arenosa]|uniref:DYW domain-containing protein n=1 Tax=Arabidopsis arenosa TaxID=38785 RepID=A0A8S2AW61_ARAAE|nr:unnamed protein product [Arabidopsis arenosa]
MSPYSETSVLLLPMVDKCINLLQTYGVSSLTRLRKIHAFSIRHGVSISDAELGKHLIFYLVSLPSPPPMSYAHKVFSKIDKPINVFIWNTLIRGYAEIGNSVSAVSLYREMRVSGLVEPDTHTYPFLLKAVTKMADVRLGETIHSVVIKSGFGSLIYVQNSLLHLYANCGDVSSAYKVFDKMPEKDLVAWNSVINGFAENGKPEEALALYTEMDSKGIKPDGFTIVSLLSACAKIGALTLDVEESKKPNMLFDEMVDKNSVSWTSLIVGLAVNGFGKEAIELFRNMESKEGLLPYLAELARMKIVQLEPNHSGDYVLLSNMYASEQRWSDVQKIRKQMLRDGVRKVPGHSLVEVGNRVHEFLMGDTSHPQSDEIYAKLKEMTDRLRLEGYVPQISNVYVDVEEEEKENALVYHSEKIAIAFMLISTPERSPIRVVKNLRVCADCHLAIKLVSKFIIE